MEKGSGGKASRHCPISHLPEGTPDSPAPRGRGEKRSTAWPGFANISCRRHQTTLLQIRSVSLRLRVISVFFTASTRPCERREEERVWEILLLCLGGEIGSAWKTQPSLPIGLLYGPVLRVQGNSHTSSSWSSSWDRGLGWESWGAGRKGDRCGH